MTNQEKVLSMMDIQEKPSETYFTPLLLLTEEHKNIFTSKSLHLKVMGGNRVRVYGGTPEQRKSSIVELSKLYELKEEKTNSNETHQKIEKPKIFNTAEVPERKKYKTYRCSGGCSCTPLDWNSPPPQFEQK
ncbi:hypothetical protein TRFO_10923 [Tritrichomonas foetus]|uniref:Uncharacterized protein n=1 Tax=Tritrichomonas foetus TaxID=1144522 RepID=A0A1J4JAS2_9EUKA|nr:hypothetical protein TRFO_10923 [Tritrichomonas foetus]|eukprot:OHS94755.1 hypothetical protein TRFO_10923 [Tritrichomonas foetus]